MTRVERGANSPVLILQERLNESTLRREFLDRAKTNSVPFVVKIGKPPKNLDLIVPHIGLGIKLILKDDQVGDASALQMLLKSLQKKVIKFQFVILEDPSAETVKSVEKNLRRFFRTLTVSSISEIPALVTRIYEELKPEKMVDLPEEKVTSRTVQKIGSKLPFKPINVEILLEVFNNLNELSKASAREIMEKTPLAQEDCIAVERFFKT